MIDSTDRKPNSIEMEQVGKAIKKLFGDSPDYAKHERFVADFAKNGRITYGDQGNFTWCMVSHKKRQFIGITKRNPTDEYVPERAESIAVYRAAEDMAIYFSDK